MPGLHQKPGLRSFSAPGSAPRYPAGRPGYRSRPRAHAAATSRRPQAKRGIHQYSGRLRGSIRRRGLRLRLPAAEKTGQAPGDPFQQEFHAGGRIVLQLRISPLTAGHDRMGTGRQQDGDVIEQQRHDGSQFVLRQGGNQVQHGGSSILILKPHQQPQQRNAGKGIQLGKTEANRASVDDDFDIFQ